VAAWAFFLIGLTLAAGVPLGQQGFGLPFSE
jgi:hypothetical protein